MSLLLFFCCLDLDLLILLEPFETFSNSLNKERFNFSRMDPQCLGSICFLNWSDYFK